MPEPKKRIRIIGWGTGRKRGADSLFSFTLSRTIRTRKEEVPKSAKFVYCFDMEQSVPHVLKLTREELDQYQII